MFEEQILRLHNQGLTSAAIANRVGCSPGYVRNVVWHEGCESKPVYVDSVGGDFVVADLDQLLHKAARQAARKAGAKANPKAHRAAVEARRAKLLRQLGAVEAQLNG
ncbi:hypothetical protein MINTM008_23760 [Mycobacterium intracellulare]|nr:hypothetical protein MINTM005_22290 [Mycobacterium intracellulare]BCO67508.1 hypothetical protein MINTM007_21190 [Mycobacterium intracellulare]BCO73041.1 hypothetical protein MINTM008_23760 [Mycobacterium intracellulare]BCO94089.1 hypothetical protein MINTM016_20650 [Mycobacterium intracellulare]BCP31461.1 hypothetical protein MINTM026_24310 [Mycobacterium intracellulare]